MQVDATALYLPATVNIMAQLAMTSKLEYYEELKYYATNLKTGNKIFYPKPFMRLVDIQNLNEFFRLGEDSSTQFLDGLYNIIKNSPSDKDIYFFKINRLFSLITGCNLRYVSSALSRFGNEFKIDKVSRNLLKSMSFYLSYQEIEFHVMYKAIKILYVLESIIDKKLKSSQVAEHNYLLLKYLIQMKKYIFYATRLEEVFKKGELIFNGNSTSAKGIIFDTLCNELKELFLDRVQKIIYPGFQEMLDFNKEMSKEKLVKLKNYISRWLHFVRYYLTIRLKLSEIGMQVIGKMVDYGKYSQSPVHFYSDKNNKYSDIFSHRIFNFSQLTNYFMNEYDNAFPIQVFTMINNSSKDPETVENVLGFFEPVSTILNIYSSVMLRIHLINPIIIFNRLLEKSKNLDENETEYYFNIYFMSEEFIQNSRYKHNKKAFNQYYLQAAELERNLLIKLKRSFKKNFENVNENLFGLAATKAIPLYNYVLHYLYNHKIASRRFEIMIRSANRFTSEYVSEDFNPSFLRALFADLSEMKIEGHQFEANLYIDDIRIQFLSYPNRHRLADPDFEKLANDKDINEDYIAFNKYSNLMGEVVKFRETKSEKEKIIINLAKFLNENENKIPLDLSFLSQIRNIFSNVLEGDMMLNQNELIQTLEENILDKSLLNKFDVFDTDNVRWLSVNEEVSGLEFSIS